MPQFLPPVAKEEILPHRGVRVDLTPYTEYIQDLVEGEVGRVELTEEDKKPTIKRRLTMAATQLGKNLKFHRSKEDWLIFTIVQPGEETEEEAPEEVSPEEVKPKRTRRKKSEATDTNEAA